MPRQNLSSFQSIMIFTGFHFQLCVDGIWVIVWKYNIFVLTNDHACKSKINVTKDLSSWKETLLFVSSARGICTYCTPWRPITWVFNQIQCRRPLYLSLLYERDDKGQRSSLLFGGHIWLPHSPFSHKDDLKKSFWKNILFGRVVHGLVWCEPDDHPFFQSIHSVG